MVKKNTSKKNNSKNEWRNLIWYFLVAMMVISVITTYMHEPKGPTQVAFSNFLSVLNNGQFIEIVMYPADNRVVGTKGNGEQLKTNYIQYPEFINEIREQNVDLKVNPTDSGWALGIFVQAFLPFILIALLWFFIFRQAKGMNSQAMSFGKTKASPWRKDDKLKKKSFKDVAGVDEAIEEVKEIVDYLKSPEKYKELGAKIPKGVLLMGPPGTGKTLIAKAIAGEADVPFFGLSGSEFVEMFVGVGASRVRDLFAQAKKNEPCIIFIDELDAVGRHRGAGLGGGHDEREQTLNQLLVEMDGFDEKETIIIIAATNRPDILDPALLRPGRFDRQVVVDKPDVKGRHAILKIHAKDKKMNQGTDIEVIAKRTPGFTGADLANLINEGALLAARTGKKKVSLTELEEATDRVMAGPERKSRIISEKERKTVAYHELGHAIIAMEVAQSDPVHKISILPRGMALGYTLQLPMEDKYLISKTEIESQIKILMGGRIAEEIIFGEITSGASNDIEKATALARNYICKFGMSSKLGARQYGKNESQVFLGKSYSNHTQDFSDQTSALIDQEMQKLIDSCYKEASKILKTNKNKLTLLSEYILIKETINGDEFKTLYTKSESDLKKILADIDK
jgi:cell division protease FtsH